MSVPLSVVIPARDEEEGLPAVLEDLSKQALPPETEVVVVNDGSRDATAQVAERAGARVIHLGGCGYGAALKAGFRAAEGEWLAFLDADGTYPPPTLVTLWNSRRESSVMLLANRFTRQNQMPWMRKVGNRSFNLLASALVGRRIHDLCSGQRLFPKRLIGELDDLPDGLDFSPALTLRFIRRGYEVAWVESPYLARVGSSKLTIVRDGFRFLAAILRFF